MITTPSRLRLWAITLLLSIIFTGHASAQPGVATVQTLTLPQCDRPVFTPDGKSALATFGNLAVLWDVDTGKEVRRFAGHGEWIRAAAFSLDGKHLVTAGGRTADMGIVPMDTAARLWDVATGKEILRFDGHGTAHVHHVEFSPDGTRVLTSARDSTARLWDVNSGKLLHSFPDLETYMPARFSPDGSAVLSCNNKEAQIWNARNGLVRHRLIGHAKNITSTIFSPDGAIVLTTSEDGTARTWDVKTGKPLYVFKGHDGPVRSAEYSVDGNAILTASADGTIKLWDANRGEEQKSLKHPAVVKSASFVNDGKQLLALWETNDLSYTRAYATLWDAAEGTKVKEFRVRGSMAVRPDTKTILTLSNPATVRDASTGEVKRRHYATVRAPELADEAPTLARGSFTSAAFSHDGKRLLTGSSGGLVQLWDITTGREVQRYRGHTDAVTSVCFSPEGQFVLTTAGRGSDGGSIRRDNTARMWDTKTGKEIWRFALPIGAGDLHSAAFSTDGKRILTAAAVTASIYDVKTGEEVMDFPLVAPSFSPDRRTVLGWLSGAMTHAHLLDAETGKQLHRFTGHTARVRSAVFSPDGKLVLTASMDGTARTWDPKTGKQVQQFTDHNGIVLHASFSADGQTVMTISSDEAVRLWSTSTGKLIRRIGLPGPVRNATMSRDGTRLLVKWFRRDVEDDTTYVWLFDTGGEGLFQQLALRANSTIAIFSPDGKKALTTTDTTTLWDAVECELEQRYR